jgi:hypothetical protein
MHRMLRDCRRGKRDEAKYYAALGDGSGLNERVYGMVLSLTGVVMEKREMTKR